MSDVLLLKMVGGQNWFGSGSVPVQVWVRFRFGGDWFPMQTPVRFRSGSCLVPFWVRFRFSIGYGSLRFGADSVLNRFRFGSYSVPFRFRFGSSSIRDWIWFVLVSFRFGAAWVPNLSLIHI